MSKKLLPLSSAVKALLVSSMAFAAPLAPTEPATAPSVVASERREVTLAEAMGLAARTNHD